MERLLRAGYAGISQFRRYIQAPTFGTEPRNIGILVGGRGHWTRPAAPAHPSGGTIRAGWRRDGGRFTYRAELPPNITATIRIPSHHAAGFLGAADTQKAVFEAGSGEHEFSGPAMDDPGRS